MRKLSILSVGETSVVSAALQPGSRALSQVSIASGVRSTIGVSRLSELSWLVVMTENEKKG